MNMERKNFQLPIIALATQTISTDTTTAGAAINLETYQNGCSLTFMLIAGTVTLGDATLLITDSDDDSIYTAVADTFLVGLESDTTVDTTSEIKTIGYVGNAKYVKASVVTANSANLDATVIALFDEPKSAPVTV